MTVGAVPQEESLREFLKDPEMRRMFIEEGARIAIGEEMAREMEKRGWTQKDLAKASGTTQPMISRFLRSAGNRTPTLATLVKWADALGCKVKVEFVPHDYDREPR